jgi:hypothetical protein
VVLGLCGRVHVRGRALVLCGPVGLAGQGIGDWGVDLVGPDVRDSTAKLASCREERNYHTATPSFLLVNIFCVHFYMLALNPLMLISMCCY